MSQPPRRSTLAGASVLRFEDAPSASRHAATLIAEAAQQAISLRDRAVLGLATGGTPIGVYAHLVAWHRQGHGIPTFRPVVTYNLDEYYPIHPADPNSYRAYMHRHLFAHVDLPPNRAHVLDGTVPESAVSSHAADFERWIDADGGLDLQLLGIGRNGHIGFNEPSDLPLDRALALRTRLIDLHPVTRADAARDFQNDESAVIPRALTLGVATILAARSILVLALGDAKAEAVAAALQGPVTPACPASLLRHAAGPVTWLLDPPAARLLD